MTGDDVGHRITPRWSKLQVVFLRCPTKRLELGEEETKGSGAAAPANLCLPSLGQQVRVWEELPDGNPFP